MYCTLQCSVERTQGHKPLRRKSIESIDFKTFSKKCAKSYFEQLSHSMSVSKINGYARIQGKTSFLATAKLAIFATDILWESCSK